MQLGGEPAGSHIPIHPLPLPFLISVVAGVGGAVGVVWVSKCSLFKFHYLMRCQSSSLQFLMVLSFFSAQQVEASHHIPDVCLVDGGMVFDVGK